VIKYQASSIQYRSEATNYQVSSSQYPVSERSDKSIQYRSEATNQNGYHLMKTYLDCIPCFFKQALFAARAAVDDEAKIKEVLDRVGMLVAEIPLDSPPPETGRLVYRTVRQITGVDDPFRHLKEENLKKALDLYPALKQMVESADNPLQTAVRLAIAGNVIDFGANPRFVLEQDIEETVQREPAINHYKMFEEAVRCARDILYLGDNAGETVFDRILIETMGRPVTYAVRDRPVINDATMEDAIASGLDKVAVVVSSGCDAPGTILARCSPEFRDHFKKADLIISKGQGNYESLSGEQRPVFYLLKVKCPVIAKEIGVKEGDTVIKSTSMNPDKFG